jgi:hypothetical protein
MGNQFGNPLAFLGGSNSYNFDYSAVVLKSR